MLCLLAATAVGPVNAAAADKPDAGQGAPLPRVLLIGDSICGGYHKEVKKRLAGKADVVGPQANAEYTGTGVKQLDEWLGDGKWDVIHFNWGLWDIYGWQYAKEDRSPAMYGKRLETLVTRLEQTGAKLIWATTTPTPPEAEKTMRDRFKTEVKITPETERQYTDAALRVMNQHQIQVNDLHALMAPQLNRYAAPDNVHFSGAGYSMLGKQVADTILAALGGRWPAARAANWYRQQPWLVGCNFIPSTAINQLEMWQADTFDPATIDRELGWAAGIGMNSVRVYLHDLLWQQDREGFLQRIDRFLDIADKHRITTLFVMCDAVWNPHPKPGKQPEPRPHVHNSGWVQSPDIEILRDERRHDSLAPYFKGVIGRFKDDRRVLGWDLYNEPGNDGEEDRMTTLEKEGKCLLLLTRMFAWAREVNPSQPLTTGLWSKEWVGPDATPLNRFIIANSDVLSFHIYDRIDKTRARVDSLSPLGRPLLCTEYLARGAGSHFEDHLPYFKQHKIGAYNWGFVAGKIQTQYPWSSWRKKFTAEPELWHHDVLRRDGAPFRQAEVDLIKSLTTTGEK